MHSFDLRSTFIREFLYINASYWTAQSKEAHHGRGVIAVDLTHDHPVILQGNLVTAKYLQLMLGCPIVGVIADWRRVFFNFSKDANLALASSYGVTEILDLEDGEFETISAPPSMRQFNRANGSELMSWRDGDFAIGEHILETYLRHFRRPALERIDADFQAIVDMTWRHKAALRAFDGKIRAFVTAHIDYSTFRLVAMRAFQDGGFVVYHRALPDTRLNVFRSREEMDQIGQSSFDRFLSAHGKMSPLNAPAASLAEVTQRAYAVKDQEYDSEIRDFVRRRGRPCVTVFQHALTDCVRTTGGMLYPTYLEWLNATLDCAKAETQTTWLIKQHPLDRDYDSTGAWEKLCRVYESCEHIRFVADRASNTMLREVSAGVITVRGAVGYEFARFGVPVLAGGHSKYTSQGFAVTPATIDEYCELLRSGLWIRPLTPEANHRAEQFWRFEEFAGRNRSRLLVYDFNYYADPAEYWRRAAALIRQAADKPDALRTSIFRCITSNEHLVLPDNTTAQPGRVDVLEEVVA
jgi:hypothetical protein